MSSALAALFSPSPRVCLLRFLNTTSSPLVHHHERPLPLPAALFRLARSQQDKLAAVEAEIVELIATMGPPASAPSEGALRTGSASPLWAAQLLEAAYQVPPLLPPRGWRKVTRGTRQPQRRSLWIAGGVYSPPPCCCGRGSGQFVVRGISGCQAAVDYGGGPSFPSGEADAGPLLLYSGGGDAGARSV